MYEDKKQKLIRYLVRQPKAVLSVYFGILVEDLTKLEIHLRKRTYLDLIYYYRKISKVTY